METDSVGDNELIAWVRGDNVRSNALKEVGLFEPARDDNAFRRLWKDGHYFPS